MYRKIQRNRALIPTYRLISALLDEPLDDDYLCPLNVQAIAVLNGLAGSPVSRYNAIIHELTYLVAIFMQRHYGLDDAREMVLTAIAESLDGEEHEIRQAFDSIIPPGKKNLPTPQRNEV
jgi:hypothetical protein